MLECVIDLVCVCACAICLSDSCCWVTDDGCCLSMLYVCVHCVCDWEPHLRVPVIQREAFGFPGVPGNGLNCLQRYLLLYDLSDGCDFDLVEIPIVTCVL